MYPQFFILVFAICLLSGCEEKTVRPEKSQAAPILHIQLSDEPITPVTARYIRRSIKKAAELNAQCLILEMDTPGGLMESTRQIVRDILGSPVPIVVYVAPTGARAASAGVFITLAAHVAVMAPGTHIGAAHPVQIGGPTPQGPSQPYSDSTGTSSGSVMEEKIVNDARAWVRTLAEVRGRNAEWAESAVSKSVSATASEAVKYGAVDFIASDLQTLVKRLDQRIIEVPGETVELRTKAVHIEQRGMWWGERLLSVLSNPNIAFLFLVLGFYGLLFEFYTPGWGVAGTLGAISMVLGFFGLAVLPVSYAGLGLVIVALGLFVAEAFVPNYGLLTLGGTACLILGGLMLVDTPDDLFRVSERVVIPVALATATITFFLAGAVLKMRHFVPRRGVESLPGTPVLVQTEFTNEDDHFMGTVRVHGELWKAVSTSKLNLGETAVVTSRKGLVLLVQSTSERELSASQGLAIDGG